MHDTTPAVDAHMRALLRARAPSERMRMATAVFSSTNRLVSAGLRYENAGGAPAADQLALLERLYGDELASAVRERVAVDRSR